MWLEDNEQMITKLEKQLADLNATNTELEKTNARLEDTNQFLLRKGLELAGSAGGAVGEYSMSSFLEGGTEGVSERLSTPARKTQ